jgi:hypothetical protein
MSNALLSVFDGYITMRRKKFVSVSAERNYYNTKKINSNHRNSRFKLKEYQQ